jgi:hypothetical protein
MGSTICTAGFPSAAIASSCFTARCDSIWYGFFIATLLFSAKENSLSAYQGWERGVATFYDLTGIPEGWIDRDFISRHTADFEEAKSNVEKQDWDLLECESGATC